jgi:glutathionylspermidine amidase/synthetase
MKDEIFYLIDNVTISGNETSAPYGTITGYASTDVAAYSNGNDSYISDDSNYLYGVYMGIKWQCVEYARRWLFIRKGCVFDSVVGAADIWTQISQVQRVVDKQCFSLKKYPNGSPNPPLNESLLIYNRSGTDFPFGHVAVIVAVLPGFIRVAEQNYYPYYWSGNYSRQIPYELINGSYYIEDYGSILGWMKIDDNNQTKPLDQTTINNIIKLNGSSPDFICSNNDIHHHFSIYYYFFFVYSNL